MSANTIGHLTAPPISSRPDVRGGEPCFTGTRLPVRTLFEYLERGSTVDEFLDCFDAVTRDQVLAVLECACAATVRDPA